MGDAHSIPAQSNWAQEPTNWVRDQSGPSRRQLVHAAVVADADGVFSPGALLMEDGAVRAHGSPQHIGSPGPDTEQVTYADMLVCPAMVNAHAHLDLTGCPAPSSGLDFDRWLEGVRAHRMAQIVQPGAIATDVQRGVLASLRGGCAFVGDIVGSDEALSALRSSPLAGCGFREFLGHGPRADEASARLQDCVAQDSGHPKVRLGLSPHAPISTGEAIFRAAAASGCPIATHLAESPEELEWCLSGTGRFQRLLASAGYAPDEVASPGTHPIDAVLPLLAEEGGLGVHLNYIEQRHLPLLASSGMTVAYCPRASRYFGHPQGDAAPHAWRAMAEHGIPVALGTDGRPCLPDDVCPGERLSVLDEVLCLLESEVVPFESWLPMVTTHGAKALGLDPSQVTFAPGRKRGVLAIDLDPKGHDRPAPDATIQWLFFDDDAPVIFDPESP